MVISTPPPVLGKPLDGFPYFLGDDCLMGIFENHLLIFRGWVTFLEFIRLGKCFKVYRMSQIFFVF